MINLSRAHRKNNVQAYLMEAAALGGFVLFSGLVLILIEHPSLPVMRSGLSQYGVLRRSILGITMGAYLSVATLLCKRSGAHMNPSVTLAFLGMSKINTGPAIFYIIAQLAGASTGALLLSVFAGKLFSHPLINYAITEPKLPYGMIGAFTAECIISFIMMFVILVMASSKKHEKYVAVVSGLLLALFIAVEAPFSGMSMNPARSFAASLAAGKWKHLWIYFTAPVISMLLAADIFLRWKKKLSIFSAARDKLAEGIKKDNDYREIPHFPLTK